VCLCRTCVCTWVCVCVHELVHCYIRHPERTRLGPDLRLARHVRPQAYGSTLLIGFRKLDQHTLCELLDSVIMRRALYACLYLWVIAHARAQAYEVVRRVLIGQRSINESRRVWGEMVAAATPPVTEHHRRNMHYFCLSVSDVLVASSLLLELHEPRVSR